MATQAHFPDHALVARFTLGGDGPSLVVKDCIDIAGMVSGCGSAALADAAPAAAHAEVVEAVLAQGTRILGKANMHELAFGMTGVNAFTGTPLNPNWPDRIPGGSSSGSAVAVAAGTVDFAIGTDTGGSIRQPAICCGIAGLKPSFGRISRKGATPADSSLDCIGPFARDAAGIEAAMTLMDPTFRPTALTHAPRLRRIAVASDANIDAAFAPVGDLALDAATLSLLDQAFAAGMTVIAAETAAAFAHLPQHLIGADVRTRIAGGAKVSADAVDAAREIGRAFALQVDAALEGCDALILPALPVVPPTLAEATDPNTVLPLTRFLRPFNLSGHPALVLPIRTADGLPAGVQIVGRMHDDARLCAIARWLEPRLTALATKELTA
ncbi:amidase [Paracoccus litorisediminis]|uniref:Amidase n=1 Tax=Paracoccus litorisediminis TaxID=2006130 RepID=A0A844HPM1_9RHOB|nr:amidase [Paracoccus litorisediminis]MTH60354.1 amidase [Paracoccus litorisediminis]